MSFEGCDCPLCRPNIPPEGATSEPVNELPVPVTPLPKLQISIVGSIQVAESVASTVAHPFINDLVRAINVTGGNEKKTGYYVGAVGSIAQVAETLSLLQWGSISDAIGRRPVILGGTFGLALSMLGVGLSTNYSTILLSHCAQGVFVGNLGVAKNLVAEITDGTNASTAFSLLPMLSSIGTALGPLIGGFLANPAERWPDLFGAVKLFKDYPYLLPCVTAASIPLASSIFGFLGLKETLPSLVEQQIEVANKGARANESIPTSTPLLAGLPSTSQGYGAIVSSLTTGTLASQAKKKSPKLQSLHDLIASRSFLNIPMINFAIWVFLDQSFLILMPLIYSTPLSLGGLGLTPSMIGSILTVWGTVNTCTQAFCFAWARQHLGLRVCYMLGLLGLGISFSLFPVLTQFSLWDGEKVGFWVWLGIVIQFGAYLISYLSYGCISIYLDASAASPSDLEESNRVAQLLASSVRSVASTAASALFSFSLELRFDYGVELGGYLVYAVLCTVSVIGLVWSFRLPKTPEDEVGRQRQITE